MRSKQILLFYTQGTQRIRVNVHGMAQQLADHLFESNLFAVGFQNLLISKNVKNTDRFKLLSCQNLPPEMKSLLFFGLFSWREKKTNGDVTLSSRKLLTWYFKCLNYQSDKNSFTICCKSIRGTKNKKGKKLNLTLSFLSADTDSRHSS